MSNILQKASSIFIVFVAISSMLAVVDHPGLWPLALGVLLVAAIEIKAWRIHLDFKNFKNRLHV